MPSPLKPWGTGKTPEFTSFRLVVNVCQDTSGNVWSDHNFLTPEDEAVASSMQYGGIPQIAHALLTEAVRREVFTSALILMGQDPELVSRWAAATPVMQGPLEAPLGDAVLTVLSKTINKMIPGALAGVLDMLSTQAGAVSPPQG